MFCKTDALKVFAKLPEKTPGMESSFKITEDLSERLLLIMRFDARTFRVFPQNHCDQTNTSLN